MRNALIIVAVCAALSATAAYAQSDDNSDTGPGATGVVTDSDGNQTTVELPDVPNRTPYPADQKTQDFMNGNMPANEPSNDQ